MAEKYDKAALYSNEVTIACEIALGLLFEAFGGFKDSLRLIGGLVPRYLAPVEPAHIGTTDVDIVLDVQVLLAGEDYSSLRDQLKRAGFQRLVKDGKASSWQWQLVVHGVPVVVEFLVNSDNPNEKGLVPLDGEEISACRIPHAGMVKDWFVAHTLRFERPDGAGISTETIRHADAAAFVALKALAMRYRHESKDVADLVHVLRNYEGAPASIAEQYAARLTAGEYAEPLQLALATLEEKFCTDPHTAGYLKDGPGRYVQFHDITDAETRTLELRQVSGLLTEFVQLVRARVGQ
ncbi:Uncharacterised protein [Delftia tsuruhatensis]|uniref:hypothetical protein n=1 Tax=Delftia tsuruhatensis TaxID=180282 RepID=UPI001E745BFB|nr:hypothetical protein [Delftia tsuruhatensis]CAB5714625.1 Uncharacterised protein [Delftia tsuruhatensis]CAC9689143.1 Uncharacterised protein [Delftia tsuruhatensis]